MSTAPIPNFGLASFSQSGTFYNDPLVADGARVTSTMANGASGMGFVLRGTLVNYNPTTLVVTAGVLSATMPNAVVAENFDATSAAAQCLIYLSGRFKADQIIWPLTGSRTAIQDVLRDNGILIEDVQLATGQFTLAVPGMTISPVTASPTAAGGAATITVTRDVVGSPGTWFATKDVTWITITAPTTPQTANGSVSYTVAVNAVGQPLRVGHIYVNGQTCTITQAAG